MKTTPYYPSPKILERYANVLVNFALNRGKGVKKGEVVQCMVPDIAKPLALYLQNAILKAGAHPIMRLIPTGFDKDFFLLANDEQLKFFPEEMTKARVDLIDHSISIIADPNPTELSGIDPRKFVVSRDSKVKYRQWLQAKEIQNKFTWTCAMWGVEAKAKEVGLSLEEYWEQIIHACFLNKKDPVGEWRKLNTFQENMKKELNKLSIEWLHIQGKDVDLKIKLGANRVWMAGGGHNIPSFEFFTSPDWHGTEGWIAFNQPLYRYGQILKGVRLEFKKGLITKASAKSGNALLQEMIKSKNANKVGEFSLTDKRMSKITHVMAETLFDENIGGPFGNTHIAIGSAYKECFRGDQTKVTAEQWEEFGFNDSSEHTDIISTTDRTVTATLTSGKEIVIYQKGKFTLL